MRLGKLGDVIIDVVIDESISEDVSVTSHPVETGVDIVDHAKIEPITVSLAGAFTGQDAWPKLRKLRQYKKDRKLLKYTGRNIVGNLLITKINRVHGSQNRLGLDFSIELLQVHIASSEKYIKNSKKRSQLSKKKNKGRQQVVRK